MTRTALALSPHLDDAAFSCGGTLALLARTGWRVIVATVFTQSVANPRGFALACQTDKGLAPDIDYMALRRAEDMVAMEALGATPVHIALPEAPHRGYGSAAELFQAPRMADDIIPQISVALAALLAEHSPNVLLAPQAVGAHVDHVQVVRAVETLDQPTVWWRDFPYAARSANPAEPFHDQMSRLPERNIALDERALAAREAACLAYTSQLGFQFGGAEGLRERLAELGVMERVRADEALPV